LREVGALWVEEMKGEPEEQETWEIRMICHIASYDFENSCIDDYLRCVILQQSYGRQYIKYIGREVTR
jgi:hypothetical protein